MAAAASFSIQTPSPARAARELAATHARVSRPSGALLFASGRLAESLPELAREVAPSLAGTPLVLVPAPGVISDHGEVEGEAAAAGIVWAGGRAEALAVACGPGDDVGEALARVLQDRGARRGPTALVFVRPEGVGPGSFEPVQAARIPGTMFGAGTLAHDPVVVDATGTIATGRVAVLLVHGLSAPVVRTSPAARLLTPLRTISETRGALVTRIELDPALDVLSAAGEGLEGQPLVFAALAEGDDPEEGRPELLLRAVQGVDPVRRGLLISDEVREGMRIAFAVRDAPAARADLEATVRDVERAAAGAAPRFGVLLSCAGRGTALYGLPDVDSKIVRTRFAELPFAGMHSAFEIAPHGGRPSLHLFTGVVALFSAPS